MKKRKFNDFVNLSSASASAPASSMSVQSAKNSNETSTTSISEATTSEATTSEATHSTGRDSKRIRRSVGIRKLSQLQPSKKGSLRSGSLRSGSPVDRHIKCTNVLNCRSCNISDDGISPDIAAPSNAQDFIMANKAVLDITASMFSDDTTGTDGVNKTSKRLSEATRGKSSIKNRTLTTQNYQNTNNKKTNNTGDVKSGRELLSTVMKRLSSTSITWMDYQIDTFLRANKILIPQYHRDTWKLKKKNILRSYGIDSLSNGLVLNIPRQMGKTLCVTRLLAEWLRSIPGQPAKPFTIITPGILKGTYIDFVSRVKHHLSGFDDLKKEFRFLTNSKSEIELINKKNPRDVRKLIGLTVNSEVS